MQKIASYLRCVLNVRGQISDRMDPTRVQTLAIVFSITSLLTLACIGNLAFDSKGPDARDDTQDYLVDIGAFLGPDWEAGQIVSERDGDVLPRADFDPVGRAIGRSLYNTHYEGKPLAFVRQVVSLFEDESEAGEYFDRGIPYSRQASSYRDLEIPPGVVFQADEYLAECSYGSISSKCSALLRYESYVVLVNAFISRDSVQYLTEDDFISVLELIDEEMVSRRESSITQ